MPYYIICWTGGTSIDDRSIIDGTAINILNRRERVLETILKETDRNHVIRIVTPCVEYPDVYPGAKKLAEKLAERDRIIEVESCGESFLRVYTMLGNFEGDRLRD